MSIERDLRNYYREPGPTPHVAASVLATLHERRVKEMEEARTLHWMAVVTSVAATLILGLAIWSWHGAPASQADSQLDPLVELYEPVEMELL